MYALVESGLILIGGFSGVDDGSRTGRSCGSVGVNERGSLDVMLLLLAFL